MLRGSVETDSTEVIVGPSLTQDVGVGVRVNAGVVVGVTVASAATVGSGVTGVGVKLAVGVGNPESTVTSAQPPVPHGTPAWQSVNVPYCGSTVAMNVALEQSVSNASVLTLHSDTLPPVPQPSARALPRTVHTPASRVGSTLVTVGG